jgi:hypothetical protein
MPPLNRIDVSVYEYLLAINIGFEQARSALAALKERQGFSRGEIARLGAIAEEARAAIASYLTDVIETAETAQAGRMSRRRLTRERRDEAS